MKKFLRNEDGFALPMIVIFGLAFLIIIISVSELSVTNFRLANSHIDRHKARMAADAGLDFGITRLNQDDTWTGTASENLLFENTVYKVTYEVTVTDIDSDNKVMEATGHYYNPKSNSTPTVSVTYESKLRALGSGGNFSVVTGVGGLYMQNNAKIVAGDVQVNGEIRMSNSAQIGLSTNPVTVEAAHQNCPNPADSNYPRICSSGENGEPIVINNTAHIYGDVYANNQTDDTGMSNSGLVASSGVTPEPLPAHDRQAQIDAVAQTETGSWATCDQNNHTETWPANLHITGSAQISQSCEIVISGDVWIDDMMKLDNSAVLTVAEGAGSTMPTIMIDGANGFEMSNSTKINANSLGTGLRIITYYSEATCSPDCTDVTGVDLYNSRTVETIKLHNNAEAPESLLYAKWTQLSISNGGDIGALVGQTVELTNNAAVTFGTTTGGGSGQKTWLIDSYKKKF